MESRQGRISRRSWSWAAAPCTSSVASSGLHGESSVQSGSLSACRHLQMTPRMTHTLTAHASVRLPVAYSQDYCNRLDLSPTFPQPFPSLYLLKFTFTCMAEPPCEVWRFLRSSQGKPARAGAAGKVWFSGCWKPSSSRGRPITLHSQEDSVPCKGLPLPRISRPDTRHLC